MGKLLLMLVLLLLLAAALLQVLVKVYLKLDKINLSLERSKKIETYCKHYLNNNLVKPSNLRRTNRSLLDIVRPGLSPELTVLANHPEVYHLHIRDWGLNVDIRLKRRELVRCHKVPRPTQAVSPTSPKPVTRKQTDYPFRLTPLEHKLFRMA